MPEDKTVILGAGPAGMACAYTLAKANAPLTILEKNSEPGGLCRTLNFHGYLFDIGGHRFLSKSREINDLWQEVMGDDMLRVKRMSRIFYRRKFFNYPLSFFNTFWNLGPIESMLCVGSYLCAKFNKSLQNNTFEGWAINHFGRRLYNIFFKSYTEKVWARTCATISSDWAIQRIRGLSLKIAIQNALSKDTRHSPKTLTKEFLYPRTGPGDFYNRVAGLITREDREILYNNNVVRIDHDGEKVSSVTVQKVSNGRQFREEVSTTYLFTSIPLPETVKALNPRPPRAVCEAADRLVFRNLVVVNVILKKEHIFGDQWIYMHSPDILMGRIQNYKNWSPAMVLDSGKTSLGLEYFCTHEDNIWNMDDINLLDFAMSELEKTGIASRRDLIDGFVVRESNVYPVYSLGYKRDVATIREYLKGFQNLQAIGRGGLFRYDNSDHALLTGIYAAKNFLTEGPYDVWSADTDNDYLES